MSAPAAAPALAIVPPDAPQQLTARPGEREDHLRRVRTGGATACVIGGLLPVASAAASPWLHGWEFLGLAISFMILFPAGALAMFVCAVTTRERDDVKAMLLAAAVFAGGIALLEPAARAGTEAYVSSHATELDALAARVRAFTPPDVPMNPLLDDGVLLRDLLAHRLTSPRPVDGGLVFHTDGVFEPSLFYADGVAGAIPFDCRNLRAIGGRWYMADCPRSRNVYSD
ncbi:MAG TPA: hypothetical protein VF092_26910 [Longimicrobium sp.]